MEIVHVRGRVTRGTDAFFLARYDDKQSDGYGAELATHGTRGELEVDGRTIVLEVARDMEAHHRGRYLGPFRAARDDWDSSFPFESPPGGLSSDDDVCAFSFSLRTGEEIEVWGEILETELEAAGYRDAPSKTPTVLRIRAIDVPVKKPPLLSLWRLGLLVLLAIIAAISIVPFAPPSPFVRFWAFFALVWAVGSAHWTIVPRADNDEPWGRLIPAYLIMLSYAAVGVTLMMPLGKEHMPAWIDELASAVLGAHLLASFAARKWRMRRFHDVAARLAKGAETGIVRAIENKHISYADSVEEGDVAYVLFDHEERRIPLRELAFDTHSSWGPRPGTRVLLGNGALYATWEDPRDEIDQILRWDRRFTFLVPALAIAMSIVTWLAYQAPGIVTYVND